MGIEHLITSTDVNSLCPTCRHHVLAHREGPAGPTCDACDAVQNRTLETLAMMAFIWHMATDPAPYVERINAAVTFMQEAIDAFKAAHPDDGANR